MEEEQDRSRIKVGLNQQDGDNEVMKEKKENN